MKIGIFSSKPYDRAHLDVANKARHEIIYFEPGLAPETVPLTKGLDVVCAFVNDDLSAPVIKQMAENGVRCIVLRCAGFNNVDLHAAGEAGIPVMRVPKYSPYAVAEHAFALILALNRKIFRAYNRVRDSNFSLDGLLGFDLHGKTLALIGMGTIGTVAAKIGIGFGMRVLAYDPTPHSECLALGVEFGSINEIVTEAHIISLHCPLTHETKYLVNESLLSKMRSGVMLINTSRGGLIDTAALIEGLKRGHIGGVGLDVYEEEEELFFEDLSGTIIQDDVFARLLTFPNVLVTAHQAFFTHEAMERISAVTIGNVTAFEEGRALENEVKG